LNLIQHLKILEEHESSMDNISQKKKEIMDYLHKVASEDQRLSKSEEKILKLVEQSLDEYEKELGKALEDNKITTDEKVSLYYKRMDILREAIAITQDDDVIEEDEDSILSALTNKLKELSKLE